MKYENSVVPNEEQLADFMKPGPDGPIYMVNLLKYKERAEYEDGRETSLTGPEAYALYAAEVTKLIKAVGGKGLFEAKVTRLMLGEVEELWDKVAIVMYPSRAAMLEMMQMPKMAEISEHRAAGLAGQLNLETADAAGLLASAPQPK